MMVYKVPSVPNGKSSTTSSIMPHWPWGSVGSASASSQHLHQVQVAQTAQASPSGRKLPGWPWGVRLLMPQASWGTAPLSQHLVGCWLGWGVSDISGLASVHFRDIAIPVGEHLTVATRDRILISEYIDVFLLLFRDLEKKEMDHLRDLLKEHIRRRTFNRT